MGIRLRFIPPDALRIGLLHLHILNFIQDEGGFHKEVIVVLVVLVVHHHEPGRVVGG